MKICHVINSLNRGGAESHLSVLINAQLNEGMNVHVTVIGEDSTESYSIEIGSPPVYVDFDIKAEKLIFYPDSDPINLTCVAKDNQEQHNIEQYFVILTGRDKRT